MAQTLHKDSHDKMLRPLYHSADWKSTNLVNLYSLNRGTSKATGLHVWRKKRKSCAWDIPLHLEKCPRNGANKPDMSDLDKVNKEWFIIKGIICMPGTIPARTMFKKEKYADLKLGLKSLYPGHKVSSLEVALDFLAAYSINLEKELAKILEDRKVVKDHRNG